MKLNPKKCSFGLAEGVFLGYVVIPEGIKPCPDKTAVVLQLPSSRTIKEVQSLNGKLAGLNRFLSKAAEKSLPLFKTLKKCIKKSDFHWTAEAEQAFKQLKQHLSELPLLILADFLIEMPGKNPQVAPATETQQVSWTLFTDGSSCVDRSGAGLILTNPEGMEFTYALRFQFAASNNEAEYEALIAGGNRGGGGRTDMDDTDSEVFKRRNSPRRQKGGKKAPPQGPTIRGSGGNPLHAVVRYAVVKMCWTAPDTPPHNKKPQQPLTPITAPWPFYKWGIDIAGPFPEGPGKVKFLIVAMDYFTKWIETKAVATITGGQVKKFVWDNIVCRFGLPEIRMPTYRTTAVDVVSNDEELRLNLDLLEERRERAAICKAKAKSKMTKYYNARVCGVTFRPGDFVYRSNDANHGVTGGKLGPKWEGPYEHMAWQTDYCIMKEGMPILSGRKSIPGINSSERKMERGYYSAFT
nr:reverse transcriptase domain-containing protein [Tanacetum cinerariifolium]